MIKEAKKLAWGTNRIQWYTPLDDDLTRFVITREPSLRHPKYVLEHRQYHPRNRSKVTTLRQLRGIESLTEAMRIAAEDWS